MLGWQGYGVKGLQVVPYVAETPVYVDNMLPFLYGKLKADGNVSTTFCGEHKTLEEFITYFDRLKTLQVLCSVDEAKNLIPQGLSWLDCPRGVDGCRAAMPGFGFFRGSTKFSRALCMLGLAYWFTDLKIDVLHGVQVASNLAARNFSFRLGFKQTALIPDYHYVNGKPEAARVVTLYKTNFMPVFDVWKRQRDLADSGQFGVDGGSELIYAPLQGATCEQAD